MMVNSKDYSFKENLILALTTLAKAFYVTVPLNHREQGRSTR